MSIKRNSPRDQRSILGDVRRLAQKYYASTGTPLGVTGELAEYEAAEKLDLELADARTAGYDAIRRKGSDQRATDRTGQVTVCRSSIED